MDTQQQPSKERAYYRITGCDWLRPAYAILTLPFFT
jgi:hypothetical protein